jgi:DNA-binding IclR family transcriptional regulator
MGAGPLAELRSVAVDRKAASTPIAEEGSHGRLLSVLSLFSIKQPRWTVDEAAATLNLSTTTAYRYFRNLTQIGLLTPVSRATYMLGPAIIEWDRQIQLCDPMLTAARGVMLDLIRYAADGAIVLLCRRYHDRVLCVHQVLGRGPQEPVSYERGRPMPLFRGATSKIILAHLSRRELRRLHADNEKEIARAGLGTDWNAFAGHLKALRRAGYSIARGEVDRGRIGIAAPVLDKDRVILGSLSFVLPEARTDDNLVGRLTALTMAGAREIGSAMASAAEAADRTDDRPARGLRMPERIARPIKGRRHIA